MAEGTKPASPRYISRVEFTGSTPTKVRRGGADQTIEVLEGHPSESGHSLINRQCYPDKLQCQEIDQEGRALINAAKRLAERIPEHFKKEELTCEVDYARSYRVVHCTNKDGESIVFSDKNKDGIVDHASTIMRNVPELGTVVIVSIPPSLIEGAQEMYESAITEGFKKAAEEIYWKTIPTDL